MTMVASPDVFGTCPELDEATVLVGSSNGKTFDRITVWFGGSARAFSSVESHSNML